MAHNKYGKTNDPNNPFVKMVPYLNFFLDGLSPNSIRPYYLQLVPFAKYMKEIMNKEVLEVNSSEILRYFREQIEPRTISKDVKCRYRIFINSYYEYVKAYKKEIENVKFSNPVPSSRIWDFTDNSRSSDTLDLGISLPTMEDIEKILHHIYFTKDKLRTFYVVSLIIYSGARIAEVVNLELKHLNLEERWFRPYVKSKKDKRRGIYFFPQFFVLELKDYISFLKTEYQDPLYLFQSRNNKPITKKTIQQHLKDTKEALGLEVQTNPHIYRDFLNTKRFEKGCHETYCTFLLNQTVKNVNPKSYLKKYKNRVALRDVYDKYNPFPTLIKPKPGI